MGDLILKTLGVAFCCAVGAIVMLWLIFFKVCDMWGDILHMLW